MSVTRAALLATVLLATTNTATALHAQSLGDLAKKTEEAQAKKTEEERVKADKVVTTDKAVKPNKAASSSSVTCDALLQHPLAWWLGSMPTSAERDQLAACLGGGSGQKAPASPSLSAAPSAAAQDKPANWNSMSAQQQAWWLCRDDPSRITDRCKVVPKETAAQTVPAATQVTQRHPSNWNSLNANQQATWTRLAPKTWLEMTSTEQVEWKDILSVGQPLPSTGVAQHTPVVAQWTADTCDSEHQSLSLLSERINKTIAQLQALAALPPPGSTAKAPPTYRCDSDSLGSRTTTTCQPDTGFVYVSPGAAFTNSLSQSLAERAADSRFDGLAAQVQTQQNQFDTRFLEWESHCTKR
jgi:hypothetical protein